MTVPAADNLRYYLTCHCIYEDETNSRIMTCWSCAAADLIDTIDALCRAWLDEVTDDLDAIDTLYAINHILHPKEAQ
jgi:hypothetical protein